MRKGRGNGGLWKARKTIVRCFPTFPQTLEIARKVHREIKNRAERFPHSLRPRLLAYVDFKSRKDKNPLRLPFAPFRLIFWIGKDCSQRTGTPLAKPTENLLLQNAAKQQQVGKRISVWLRRHSRCGDMSVVSARARPCTGVPSGRRRG